MFYVIVKERNRDFRVYVISPYTGHRKECIGEFETLAGAKSFVRKLYRS